MADIDIESLENHAICLVKELYIYRFGFMMNINKQLIFRYKLHAACLSSNDTEICGISSFLVFTISSSIMYTGVLNHIACQEIDGINSLGNFVN